MIGIQQKPGCFQRRSTKGLNNSGPCQLSLASDYNITSTSHQGGYRYNLRTSTCKSAAHSAAAAMLSTLASMAVHCPSVTASDIPSDMKTLPLQPIHVVVTVKSRDDALAVGQSPTLFLTARPANSKYPFASFKEALDWSSTQAPSKDICLGQEKDLLIGPQQYEELSKVLKGQDETR
ncbi:hypothetical protein CEUSTIGMA_g7624.t1 [Chlamydomonas eustigma]|uniref:Uncharacterized protein n=1 Tax=Chlamydomonas eustigma TaxID=1157962 RepID=A0A250XAX1_9CHLO|nr:hypothetical protein CEUSTIGMA_g7624.t1 [Chlamydomonas eustigma]|eukprot:GAX80186.1 hypothetical protein CEUSTIGMA_g7624.t1 [Chlamydomonas eustigma]